MQPEAHTVSFVLRFVYEEPPGADPAPAATWYSVVRHVQSNTERRFTRWEDVVAFLAQFIDLQRDGGHA
ncbi:MAG TPA: hypothetical protein VKY74_15025 [Chloroflexia bacterium]|nr:hypothetical protein [Chloroflexia bacterium]